MLGIDDPVVWMNATPPKTLDLWIAYIVHESQKKETGTMGPAEKVLGAMAAKLATNP